MSLTIRLLSGLPDGVETSSLWTRIKSLWTRIKSCTLDQRPVAWPVVRERTQQWPIRFSASQIQSALELSVAKTLLRLVHQRFCESVPAVSRRPAAW